MLRQLTWGKFSRHIWGVFGQRSQLRDVGYQSAWIIGAVCPARDTGVALVITRLDTAAMKLFLAELGQAVAPGGAADGQSRLAYG